MASARSSANRYLFVLTKGKRADRWLRPVRNVPAAGCRPFLLVCATSSLPWPLGVSGSAFTPVFLSEVFKSSSPLWIEVILQRPLKVRRARVITNKLLEEASACTCLSSLTAACFTYGTQTRDVTTYFNRSSVSAHRAHHRWKFPLVSNVQTMRSMT